MALKLNTTTPSHSNMISVCIPTYNGEKFIREQLDSILNQSTAVNEIIISDDSSTDNTIDIIKSYKDSRIRIFENQKFKSPVFNLENALKHSKGDYIFLADQDDVWKNNKVEVMLNYLQNHQLVVSDGYIIDEEGEIIEKSIFNIYNSKSGFLKNLFKNSYMGCCMAFDRQLLNYVLPFPKGIAMHDLWIGLNAELFFSVCFCKNQLVSYKRHGNNTAPLKGESKHPFSYKIKYRIEILFFLLKNYIQQK